MNQSNTRTPAPEHCRPFVLSELWAGSDGMKCEQCERRTFTVFLSESDIRILEETDRNQSLVICERKLGAVLCRDHAAAVPKG